ISALVEAGAASAAREIDARGLLALPGMVDAHVHFNEPGRTDWEGWSTGSRAAAAGGTTTVLDMPLNSVPPVLAGGSVDLKEAAARVRGGGRHDAAAWVQARPPLVEVRAVAAACAAAREAGARIHIVHVSAIEALGAVGAAREMGTDVTVETCPHYLTFDDDDLARHGAALKCAPPIRDARNRDGLWRAMLQGKIDFVA